MWHISGYILSTLFKEIGMEEGREGKRGREKKRETGLKQKEEGSE